MRQADEAQRTRQRVLKYIAGYQDEHGWAPTVREIASAVGLASPSSVHGHLLVLRDRGDLVLGNGPRMIRLTSGRIELRPPERTPMYDALRPGGRGDGRLEPGR